jgi:hypothetical protein
MVGMAAWKQRNTWRQSVLERVCGNLGETVETLNAHGAIVMI